jgi:hypothetical protein
MLPGGDHENHDRDRRQRILRARFGDEARIEELAEMSRGGEDGSVE